MTESRPPLSIRLVTLLFWASGGSAVAWMVAAAAAGLLGFELSPGPAATPLGLLLAAPLLATAWGLGRRRLWARWTGIALALLAVGFFPTGTILGLLVLGVLLRPPASEYFGGDFL